MENNDLSKLKIDKDARKFRPGRRRRPLYWLAVVLIIIVLGVLYLTGVIAPAVTVEVSSVSQVYPSQTYSLLNASGYVVAQRKAAVASKITGRLVELMVEEGDRVREGQIIAKLENEDALAARNQAAANLNVAEANLELAKAELEEAARNFNRNKQLVAKGVISRAEYDVAETRYQRAQAQVAAAGANIKANAAALQAARASLEYTLIRAPFDAVVLTKNADIGDIVTPLGAAANAKAAVVSIADLGSLQVEADVSETNLSTVKVGQPCEIQLDAFPEARFRGVVHAIVPTADRTKATVMVKVRFVDKDPRVLPEMRAKVAFLSKPLNPGEQKPITAVHRSALVNHDGTSSVFLVREGNRVGERTVKVGAAFGDMVEILDGVKPGDQVVMRPPERMKNGTKIKIGEK
jgi:RND family efflux transporter MFP subunit